ncbi:MAG TPA: polyhydroxyalkanoate synthesis repressor PhaR [Acidiphilium sp.]|nr:MAG: polyhydroxyalkanoate synthesis repressor PhaR [Acidiphilium sp. 21-60-14]OYV90908.1 MAG: polyhydroxyalkanoate synthesis repressor PhaR [Acidiphilium sp. 37-60-79]HQT88285.1 polyhydroxyalkanoate synthesis repressor PhaR [Acidiphilium sp.]HQU23334.1 polyhydroxyalkanoate synthesis repressor PhaR [Acidiphilium sp.]
MPQDDETPPEPPVIVKKYANRRLYNTETSSYITLDTLADMVRAGRHFVVSDAKTGEDITRAVLTQIIVEEESKDDRAMLPINFLRQLIGLYGDNLQSVVPRYLDSAMSQFGRQQRQMREAMQQTVQQTMQQTMGRFLPPGMEEIGRQNIAMIERAMGLFAPFATAEGGTAPADERDEEIRTLRAEVERLQAELAHTKRAPRHGGS